MKRTNMIKNQEQENEKLRGCDIRGKRSKGMGLCILICLIFSSMVSSAQAMKLPQEYGVNQCELIAKDYCNNWKNGSCSLVFIIPVTNSGAFILGDYSGHLINKVWSQKTGLFYIDYQNQEVFKSEKEISDWYTLWTGRHSKIYDLSKERSPFPINWHY